MCTVTTIPWDRPYLRKLEKSTDKASFSPKKLPNNYDANPFSRQLNPPLIGTSHCRPTTQG